MTIVQPTLWGDLDPGLEAVSAPATPAAVPAHDSFTSLRGHTQRIVAHSSDRVAWLRARAAGITATDVARLASLRAVEAVVADKRYGSRFSGNAFTEHGKDREPVIAAWVAATHGIQPSAHLFHAAANRAHLATPDGVGVDGSRVVLAEIKTTGKAWRSIPRHYLRQIWWQQYVLGADRTLFVWERHDGFVPVADEPECRWVDRDDDQIRGLVQLADLVLDKLRGFRS
ncbi:YqaJ viral recombinase family protein [Curtobacterium sp. PhB115]|uniref:YqaJ viral recombinase family protein n=1 Tax=Curtobacterium sp. PhB115 TaxID=2485173 RepID=UPI000F4CAC57|nr:YqaJ viral recombinase family protein [Curtobacterium sp. PhB115]ROP64185.1 YqaJ-like recombinase protein [Curtobacterium sp. PhB115]